MNQLFSQTVWLVPIYTLIGMALTVFWSPAITYKTGPRPSGYVNIITTVIAFFHSLLALRETYGHPAYHTTWTWLDTLGLSLNFDIEVSSVTTGALLLITGLNLMAQIYAIAYLEMDWGWARFFALMGLFEAGMCALVICDSLFFSYVMLEILTLGTYLLIGYWFNQSLVVTGARDAFLTKRVGDLFLLMGVVALLPLTGTWNYHGLAQWAETANIQPWVANLLCLTLVAGPLGKCALFPFHLWLDEAMEGPMPATILRNSIVVSVGAYVLVKLQPVLALSPMALNFMIVMGAFTAISASLIAIAQIDVKRSLSYTVSAYMGLVFMAVGTQQDSHEILMLLLTYAVGMAILVMTVGGVVFTNVTQDLTQYGGLWSRRPISGICYLIGGAFLIGIPPLGGFYSFVYLLNHWWENHPVLGVILLLVNGITAFSLTREFCLIFGGEAKPMTVRSPEALWPLVVPMTITAGFALHLPILLGQWGLLPDDSYGSSGLFLIVSSLVGIGLSAFIYLNKSIQKPIQLPSKTVQDFFAYDFYTPQLYRVTIVFVVGLVSNIIYWFDRYLVDGVVNLVGFATLFSGQSLKYNVSGQTQFYFLSIFLGVILFIGIVCWSFLDQIPSLLFG